MSVQPPRVIVITYRGGVFTDIQHFPSTEEGKAFADTRALQVESDDAVFVYELWGTRRP